MKDKSLRKNILREIKSTLNRFIAIFAICALGAGFFAGLKSTGPNMKSTADRYYEEQQMMDIRLLSPLGFTDEDIEALRAMPEVESVMPAQGVDYLLDVQDATRPVRFHTLPRTGEPALNQPVLLEGRWPEAPDECVVDSAVHSEDFSHDWMGSALHVSDQNTNSSLDLLTGRDFKVVGYVRSPMYISYQRGNTGIGAGELSAFVYVPFDTFDSDVYTEVFVRTRGHEGLGSYTDAYADAIEADMEVIDTLGEARSVLRLDDLQRELDQNRMNANNQLAGAALAIREGETAIADGWASVADAQQELADARQEIADAQTQIDSSRGTLDSGWAAYRSGLNEFNTQQSNYNTLAQTVGTLSAGIEQARTVAFDIGNPVPVRVGAATGALDAMAAFLNGMGKPAEAAAMTSMSQAMTAQLANPIYDPGPDIVTAFYILDIAMATIQNELSAGAAQLAAAQGQLNQAYWDLTQGSAALADAETQLADARVQLADGEGELADAIADLKEAEQTLADGKADYAEQKADADQELADAQQTLNDARENPGWYVMGRSSLPSYSGLADNAERMDAISRVFPVFFFSVAVLVCLTTMTRMVEEQRGLIGALKALGYSRRSIIFKFMFYATVASLLSSIFGVVVGEIIFPLAIWTAYSLMYNIGSIVLVPRISYAAISVLLAVGSTSLATVWASASELAEVPAELMRPKAPKPGKKVLLERLPFLWKRLNFSAKVTCRNLFRYKKRFFMTVIGVMGCTALLVTGFGIKDSISGLVDTQYGEINQTDILITLKNSSYGGADTPLNQLLGDYGTALYSEEVGISIRSDSGSMEDTTRIFLGEDPDVTAQMINFRTREGHTPIAFPQGDKIILTEKLAKALDVQPGDTVEITLTTENKTMQFVVAGIAENYMLHYVYMTPETFTNAFGITPEYNTVNLLLAPGADGKKPADRDPILRTLMDTDNVLATTDIAAIKSEVDDILNSLNQVVWVVILSAAALAVVVLYNLTNINITERMREIATLKVLGFYDKEVSNYVYRENLLLTLIGMLLGLVGGIPLHRYIMTTVEINEMMFKRYIAPTSFVLSVVFTLGAALLVNLLMMPKLKHIDMVESLKSTE